MVELWKVKKVSVLGQKNFLITKTCTQLLQKLNEFSVGYLRVKEVEKFICI